MKCNEIQNLLLDYIYGVLEPAEEQFVDDHLSHCADCQKALVWAKNKKTLIKEATVQTWPEVQFSGTLLKSDTPSWRHQKNQRQIPYGLFAALAALLLLQIAPLWIYFSSLEVNRQALADQATNGEIEKIQNERQQLGQVYQSAVAEEVKKLGDYPKVTVQMDQGSGKHVTLGMEDAPGDQKLQVQVFQGNQKVAETTLSKEIPSGGFAFPGEKIQGPLILQVRNEKNGQTIAVPLFDLITFLHLDRASYRPGDTVRYRSITLNRVDFTPIGSSLALRYFLIGPDGEKEVGRGNGELRQESGTPLLNASGLPVKGVGVGSFQIPADAKIGEWKVEVRDALNRFQPVSQTIQLVSRTELNLYHEIRFDKRAYFPGDRGVATIRAWDLNNVPLARQKMILTLAFGGVAHQTDGTLMKRGKIERETSDSGMATVEFQIPAIVAAGNNEMVVQIPSGNAFSSVAAAIPLFVKRPTVSIRRGNFRGRGAPGSVLVWATDEKGNPSPLKGQWKARNSEKRSSLTAISTEFPLGVYQSQLESEGVAANQDWELHVQGPGEPQTVSLPKTTEGFSADLGEAQNELTIQSSLAGSWLCQVLKKGRILAEKQVELSVDQPSKVDFGAVFAEKGLYLIRLEQKTAKGPMSHQTWVNAGDPRGPTLESDSSSAPTRFFLKGADGKTQTGLAMAMIYQEGSPWEDNGKKAPLICWLAELQSENLAAPVELTQWLGMLPQKDWGSFLSRWLSAFPTKAIKIHQQKSLAIQNPFLQPITQKLKTLSRQLDETYQQTNQKLQQLQGHWVESAPAREKALETSQSMKSWFWAMGLVQLAGLGIVLVLQRGLPRPLYWTLILLFTVCSAFGWIGLTGAKSQLGPQPPWESLLTQSKPDQSSAAANQGQATAAPLSSDGHPQGSGFPPETIFANGATLQPFWMGSPGEPLGPKRAHQVQSLIADHPAEWPMPSFLAERKGFNHADASSHAQSYEAFFRENSPGNLAHYPLVFWDPCAVLGKEGWRAPELAQEPVRKRIFLLAVSQEGGIACLDQPYAR